MVCKQTKRSKINKKRKEKQRVNSAFTLSMNRIKPLADESKVQGLVRQILYCAPVKLSIKFKWRSKYRITFNKQSKCINNTLSNEQFRLMENYRCFYQMICVWKLIKSMDFPYKSQRMTISLAFKSIHIVLVLYTAPMMWIMTLK